MNNDRQSQFQLYECCFDAMMAICMRYVKDRDTAMDVLNQAFIKVLKKLDSFEQDRELLPWVKRITANMAIDHYRQNSRRSEFVNDNIPVLEQEAKASDPFTDAWVEEEYLQHLLNQLKEVERTVFNLFAIDGFSHKEIAASLGITERSSIRHLTNARRKLQCQLSEMEPGIKKA